MLAVGPGRTNLFAGEQIWRADGINSAGDTNLQFAFYKRSSFGCQGVGQSDEGIGVSFATGFGPER